jgi:hypothetical protein
MNVVDVELKLLKSNPPQLHISAIGLVGSAGWTTSKRWKEPPLDKLKGVRVHSANNSMEAHLKRSKSLACG